MILRALGTWNMLRLSAYRGGVYLRASEKGKYSERCAGASEWWARRMKTNGSGVSVKQDDEARVVSLHCEGRS